MKHDLNELGERTAISTERRGFNIPRPPTIGEMLSKIMAEGGECVDAWLSRFEEPKGAFDKIVAQGVSTGAVYEYATRDGKPEGLAAELADVILTCLAIGHELGLDMNGAVARKAAYNDVRPVTKRRMA